jgi:hypothetical protein
VPLQRLYGGPAIVIAMLLGLGAAWAGRKKSAVPIVILGAGVGALVVSILVFGWQSAPGEIEGDPLAAARLAVLVDPARLAMLPGGAASAWTVWMPVFGVFGLALVSAFEPVPVRARLVLGVVLAGLGVPLENPRLVAPVTSLPPDPIRDTLAHLPSDRLVIFPAPQGPYLQGQRPAAAWAWAAASGGQQIELTGEDEGAAALIGALSSLTEAPVDVRAAKLVSAGHAAEPLKAARAAKWRYLLVDLDALPPMSRPRLDGWLAERAGMPVARDGSRLLYDLSTGPAGAQPVP